MSTNTIRLRSYSPDLLVEFDLPPGTHARIGASPQSEISLPLTGIPPFSCMIGRFQNGRLFLADLDGAVSRRVDLPDELSLPPYRFSILDPADSTEIAPLPAASSDRKESEPLKILPLALGAVAVLGVAAVIAVSQCGKPAANDRPGMAAPTRTVPQSQAVKPTPAPAAPVRPVPPAGVKKEPPLTR